MDYVTIEHTGKIPKLKNPILIEGLPGIGNVGKLAVEHLIDSINATKFADMYSKDFPPQVFINPDGTTELVKNEFFYWKAKNKNQRDHQKTGLSNCRVKFFLFIVSISGNGY